MGEDTGRTPSTAGTLIAGRYELVAPLGSGGMAQVWSATDQLLSRRVAVKILHRHLLDDPSFVQRFRREAVSAARLVHPNIVAVYDTVSAEGCEAIVMELVDGVTLREHLDRHGTLSETRVREIGRDLAGALDCAHRNGVVHRDIKPANILLTDDGSVRLADFGIAKAEEDPDLTVAGTLVGTAAYLAPEQVGGGTIDQRTDLYSLSTVLYEAASGSTPFRGDSPAATALARLHQDPADLASAAPGVSSSLRKAIMRNLERAPERRFQSALDFGTALASPGGKTRRRAAAPPARPPVDAAAAAAAAAAAVERDRRRSRSERGLARAGRPVGGRIVMGLLVAGPIALVVALLLEPAPRSNASNGDEPTGTTLRSLNLSDATPFDPGGDTTENNRSAPNAVDDEPGTRWSTEGYYQRDFGQKKVGVGLAVRIDDPVPLESVRIVGTTGWAGSVYVLDAAPDGGGPPASGGVPIDASTSPVDVDLDGAEGSFLLIWITDPGPADTDGSFRVGIDDIEVTGRVRSGG